MNLTADDTSTHFNLLDRRALGSLALRHRASPATFFGTRLEYRRRLRDVNLVHVLFQRSFLGLLEALNVNLPTGEPRGETSVLSLLADCQTQLIIGNDHAATFPVLAYGDADNFGGAE